VATRTLTIAALLTLAVAWWLLREKPGEITSTAPPLVNVEAVPEESETITEKRHVMPILVKLHHLEDSDQAGLDRLFAELGAWISEDPDRAAKFFDRRVPSFSQIPLEESFFLVHGFLRFSPEPEKRALAVLHARKQRTPSYAHHVGEMSPAERLDRVKSFTLRQFPREAPRALDLLPAARQLAVESRSLDVAREAVLVVKALSPNPELDLEEILAARPPGDRVVLNP